MKISMKQKFNRSSSSYARLIKNCRCSGIIILFPYGKEGDKDIAPYKIQVLSAHGDWIYFAGMIKSLVILE